jgi:hypothetical protein
MVEIDAKIKAIIKDSQGNEVEGTINITFDENDTDFSIDFKYIADASDGGPILMPQTPPVL